MFNDHHTLARHPGAPSANADIRPRGRRDPRLGFKKEGVDAGTKSRHDGEMVANFFATPAT